MTEQKQTLEKIDLYRIFRLALGQAKTCWRLILALSVGLGGLAGIWSAWSYVPRYQATATYAAISSAEGYTDIAPDADYYDIQSRERIVSTFPYILESDIMMERLNQALGLNEVPDTVTAEAVGITGFFKVTVTGNHREQTLMLLETIMEHYPEAAKFVVGNTSIETVELPQVAHEPINRFQVLYNGAVAAAVGAGLSFAILILLAGTRQTVETASDLKKELELPCLGTIPHVTKKSSDRQLFQCKPDVPNDLEAAVGDLRVRLLRSMEKRNPCGKLLLITSTLPGEGKTTTAVNLAASLAKSGKRVILVDADLRNQTIKKRLDIRKQTRGLLELLEEGDEGLSDCLVQVPELPLYLLSGDQGTKFPVKQLESPEMKAVLSRLRQLADVVILDAPAAHMAADAAILGREADFCLYVVQYDGPDAGHAAERMRELQRLHVELLGYVINNAPRRR